MEPARIGCVAARVLRMSPAGTSPIRLAVASSFVLSYDRRVSQEQGGSRGSAPRLPGWGMVE
jgi:hypothetical protein